MGTGLRRCIEILAVFRVREGVAHDFSGNHLGLELIIASDACLLSSHLVASHLLSLISLRRFFALILGLAYVRVTGEATLIVHGKPVLGSAQRRLRLTLRILYRSEGLLVGFRLIL